MLLSLNIIGAIMLQTWLTLKFVNKIVVKLIVYVMTYSYDIMK